MRTTIHGPWPKRGLYPDFTLDVAKYTSNGGARTKAESRAYRAVCRRRAPLVLLSLYPSRRGKNLPRPDSAAHRTLKLGIYRGLRRRS